MASIEERLAAIEERNRRVEADKTWETSILRRCSIAVVTYISISILMMVIDTPRPFIDALVPTAGFILSTFSLSLIRSLWRRFHS